MGNGFGAFEAGPNMGAGRANASILEASMAALSFSASQQQQQRQQLIYACSVEMLQQVAKTL